MKFEIKLWLYGTSAGKTNKKLVRIPEANIAKAKGFHLFFRKTPRSKWRRITDEIELIPGPIRSKVDKELYIESFVEAIKYDLAPAPIAEPEPVKEIELPELPKEPRVTLTKKQFNGQMSRILYDELDLENMKWSENRIDKFIDKMWKAFNNAPHLITSEQFKRGLVTKEIKRIRDKKLRKKEGVQEEAYRRHLEGKEVSLDASEVGGDVKVQFKEVFNTQGMKSPDDMTMNVLQDGLIVEKERQSVFAQVQVEYDKMMAIDKSSLLANDPIVEIAFSKVRSDIEKLFDQALEKGLFRPGEVPEYSFRLLVPLVNGKGEIPSDYFAKKGKKRTGHGFSTVREKVKNKKDLKKVLDELFNSVKPALARYLKLNNSSGFLISGFTMERLIR
jgi:hypothetical protein